MLEVPDWVLTSWYWLWYGHCSLIHPCSKFQLSILFLKEQKTSRSFKSFKSLIHQCLKFWISILILKVERTHMSLKSLFGTLEDAVWGLLLLSWFGYSYWSLIHSYSELWLSILILKEQRKSTSFKSWFQALEDAEVPDWGLEFWSWFGYSY